MNGPKPSTKRSSLFLLAIGCGSPPESDQQQSYWQLDPEQETRLKSDQEYAEAFRAIFSEAVSCRLQGDHPVGILLSGGLDSSFVACTARQLLPQDRALAIFSAIFPSLSPKELQQVDDQP